MTNNEIVESVTRFYEPHIYPICPKIGDCNRENSEKFSKMPKMSYIGREYGNKREIPNLVFLSLDSGDTKENYSTISQLRNYTENDDIMRYEKNLHWFQTFNLSCLILKPFLNDMVKNENEVKPYIVHANSAKCNQGKKGRKQADNILFKNCREYVLEELPLYEPDIIVSQGYKAWDVIGKADGEHKVLETIAIEYKHNSKIIKMSIFIRDMNGRKFLHIPMYHPSYFRGYWGQKECIKANSFIITEKLTELMNSNSSL